MTCLFGWPVQGIWPGLDYTDVNAVDRSRNGTLLATGDDFGTVKLFKYPSCREKAAFNDYHGHSSHVTGVKFTANDTLLISAGGNDKTVMVWDTDINDDDQALFGMGGGQASAAAQVDDDSEEEKYGGAVDEGFEENRTDQAKESRQESKAKR